MTLAIGLLERRLALWWCAAGLLLPAACKRKPTEPESTKGTATTPVLLSVGSAGKDEDPSVLRASDGRLFVAWFSERNSNTDIYISSTTDKVNWSPATRVSTGPNGDFYPNLIQDAAGKLHLVWFQWVAPYVGQIRHASSTDGVTWSAEEAVTTNLLVDDWVPTVAEAPNGTLLVYFVSYKRDPTNSTNQIYVATKRPGQSSWDAAVVAAGINSATEHDQLPFVARTGNQLTLVWVRYDTRDADFITNNRSELYLATSADGLAWSAPLRVTTDSKGQNLFPQLYQRHDGVGSPGTELEFAL